PRGPAAPGCTLLPSTTLFRSHPAELLAEICGILQAAVEAERADRIVDVGRVAGQQHAALAEGVGNALVHPIGRSIGDLVALRALDRKSTRLNSSHVKSSYAAC